MVWYFEDSCVVFCSGLCRYLKKDVWYCEEGGVALLKMAVWYFAEIGVVL